MLTVTLKDTRAGELVALREPGDRRPVSIYACGPTVYDRIHVGNARPFVVFALLRRLVAHTGRDAKLAVNITDINDKIYDRARALGIGSEQLAADMTAAYITDTSRLGLGRPDFEPRASEHIGGIVALIAQLVDRGHAYAADGDVYFSVRSFPAYGQLSRRDVHDMNQGERADAFARKRDAADFALWKADKDDEDTAWPSPWGMGRPGWHIECSAMAETLLGADIDVHGGGIDLLFPHHENEQAQTHAAHDHPLARIWMHNGMLQLGEKMSKSVGNVIALHDALDDHGPLTLIALFAATHYSQPLAYTEDALAQAAARVKRIMNTARSLADTPLPGKAAAHHRGAFERALADNLNTSQALTELFAWMTLARREHRGLSELRDMLWLLGLDRALAAPDVDPNVLSQAQALMRTRTHARADRDYPQANAIRDQLAELGFAVRDTPDGSDLVKL